MAAPTRTTSSNWRWPPCGQRLRHRNPNPKGSSWTLKLRRLTDGRPDAVHYLKHVNQRMKATRMNSLSQRKVSMNARHVYKWCAVGALVAFGLSLGLNKAVSAQPATPVPPAPANTEQGVQVLTRGPVHEAFAETVTFDPEPGIVVPKAPPAAIEEVPPEQRLEGANVAWIPGYWAWDDERKDFLWVSGIWRDLPPGRQWVPGYWGKAGQGYQWTSGYWADAKVSEVQYLPEPPATVETGPNIAASSADQTLAARLLDLAEWSLCLAARFLGQPRSRIGIGFPPITFGPRAATSCRRLLGSLRSAVAACCLRRYISMRACMRGRAFPTRLRR